MDWVVVIINTNSWPTISVISVDVLKDGKGITPGMDSSIHLSTKHQIAIMNSPDKRGIANPPIGHGL